MLENSGENTALLSLAKMEHNVKPIQGSTTNMPETCSPHTLGKKNVCTSKPEKKRKCWFIPAFSLYHIIVFKPSSRGC